MLLGITSDGDDHPHRPRYIPSRPVRSSPFLARWQGEMQRGAAIAIGRRPEPAAVGLNDRAADRQSHAHALRLGRIKGLEETLKARRIQSRTRILYHDHHTLRVLCPGGHE